MPLILPIEKLTNSDDCQLAQRGKDLTDLVYSCLFDPTTKVRKYSIIELIEREGKQVFTRENVIYLLLNSGAIINFGQMPQSYFGCKIEQVDHTVYLTE